MGGVNLLGALVACSVAAFVGADFAYTTFSDTSGLVFLGSATTSDCSGGATHPYQPRHGSADGSGRISGLISEGVTTHTSYETSTNDPSESDYIASALSVFGHREAFAESPDPRRCDLRMRVRDKAFSTRLYESCMVHGGDGFAFVLHNDANRTRALGVDGERLGYTGIRNAIAVEFDTWYNPDIGDLFHDHISLQASGPLAPLASNQSQLMGAARPHPLADGKVHSVKLQYFPHLKYELLEHFSATPQLVPFLKDAGESRRIGTFVVYIDNMTTPLTAVPINLNVAMDLPDGQAYAGFTASTGKAWERHDMLSWYFCEYPGCPRSGLGPVDWQATLDFMDEDEVNPR